MTDKIHSGGKRYRQPLEMDVFEAARQRMKYVYENFDDVVISWSGGKDSSACLELAREAAYEQGKLPIKVMFLDEEVIYPETLDLCYAHMAETDIEFYWVCVPSIYRNACSEVEPDFIPFDPTKKDLWTHMPPESAIWPAGFDENGLPNMTTWRVPPSIPKRIIQEFWGGKGRKVANITGLRTQESYMRYSGIMSSVGFITKPENGIYGVRPIYDWSASDIWLAIKENKWAYNKAYEKLWRAGGNPVSTRVAPLFHAEAAMNLRTVMLFWPEFWHLVRNRVRGAHAVAIHGGALHKVERLKGETWQIAATRYLNSLGSEADRTQMHEYVQKLLDVHAKHSQIPLQEEEPCAYCDISWKKIARACARGDRQQRMINRKGASMQSFRKLKTEKGN